MSGVVNIRPQRGRMSSGLYAIKPWFTRRLRRMEDAAIRNGVTADALTFAAVAASAAAGAALAFGPTALWWIVPVLGVVRLGLNALDGSVARRTGSARPWGAVLNEMCDRISDAALLCGVAAAIGPWALGALAAALFASLSGVLSLAVTGARDSSGPMGKADRVAVVSTAAAAGALTGSEVPLVAAAWAVGAGALLSAVLRLRRIKEATDAVCS